MNLLFLIGIGIAAGGIALIWWRLRSLTQDVAELTRRQYDEQNKSSETARQQSEALTILRVQLAQLASGQALDGSLVRMGSLYHQVDADEARRMIERDAAGTGPDLIVVDVRSQKEFLHSHIPGAKHIPLEELETRFQAEVSKDTNTIVVYCSRGERSRLACDFLSRDGYTTLVNMRDGFQAWTGPVLGAGSPDLVQIQPGTARHDAVGERAKP
ncbi:MAG: rhodanese-like domain-containing protein [Nitrospira sp.]|nr:rhodanese-like domain-containing protein [Nitrospira sp.]